MGNLHFCTTSKSTHRRRWKAKVPQLRGFTAVAVSRLVRNLHLLRSQGRHLALEWWNG